MLATDAELIKFVEGNFEKPGNEYIDYVPDDFRQDLDETVLNKIQSVDLKTYANEVHNMWKILSKVQKSGLDFNKNSALEVDYGVFFAGVPRFRETYYWDSYWILKGLLVSGMENSALNIVEVVSDYVDNIGHVPNGGRIYYTNRSQPPLFGLMLESLSEKGIEIKNYNAKHEIEMRWWLDNRFDKNLGLFHYGVQIGSPRPEGYNDDWNAIKGLNQSERCEIMNNIASTAESGWDFSTRWLDKDTKWVNFVNFVKFEQELKTKYIMPVDLNSIMVANFRRLCQVSGYSQYSRGALVSGFAI